MPATRENDDRRFVLVVEDRWLWTESRGLSAAGGDECVAWWCFEAYSVKR